MSLNSFGNKLRSGPLGAIFFGIVVLCVGVLAFTGLGSYVNNRPKDNTAPSAASDVVATVNGTPITVSQFQNALEQYKQMYESYGPTPSIASAEQIRVGAFNELIIPVLKADLAKADGLTVTDDEVSAERTKQLGPLKKQLGLQDSASESDIDTALQQYGRTIDDLINMDDLKIELLAKKYDDHVTEANQASEETVQNYYEQVHIRHIEVSNQIHPDSQAKALATFLIGKLQTGADFGTLAKQYSDDAQTKSKGGDDGFVDQSGPFPPQFKTAALALKAGQLTTTPVLVPQLGYYIIQAIAVRSNLPKDYQKNHETYVQQVTQSLAQQQEETEIGAEKSSANIVAKDPRLMADLAVNNPVPAANQAVVLQQSLANYQKSLGSANDSDKAEIYAAEASIYQQLHQPDQQAAALNTALNSIEDSQLRLELGDLYRAKGDTADAIKQYQIASDHSYDNSDIHVQLMQDYQALKQPVLAAQEVAWLKSYQARQKQANAQVPTGSSPQ